MSDQNQEDQQSRGLEDGDLKETIENAPESTTDDSIDTINPGVDKDGGDSSKS